MADDSWEDLPLEQQVTAPSRRVPPWLLFCGCGCLLAVLAVVVATLFTGFYMTRLGDPEHQLPRLARVLPFDEPLEELELVVGWPLGLEAYVLRDPHTEGGYVLVFAHESNREKARELRGRVLDPAYRKLAFGLGTREDVVAFTLEVQGRVLEGVRFHVTASPDQFPIGPPLDQAMGTAEGAAAYLDVTPPGLDGLVLLQVHRAESGREPIPDEYLRRVLEPFHVGPER